VVRQNHGRPQGGVPARRKLRSTFTTKILAFLKNMLKSNRCTACANESAKGQKHCGQWCKTAKLISTTR